MIVDQTVAKQERVPLAKLSRQQEVFMVRIHRSKVGRFDLDIPNQINCHMIRVALFLPRFETNTYRRPILFIGFLENMWLTQHVHAGRCHHRALRVRRPTSPFVSCPFGSWQELSIFRHSPKTLSISKGRRTDRDSRTRCPPLHRSCHLINYKIHVRQESSIDL